MATRPQPGAYFRVKLCALFGISPQELFGERRSQEQEAERLEAPDIAQLFVATDGSLTVSQEQETPPIWNVPSPRNPFFLGRDELLSQLHTQFQTGLAMALSQPQAVSGLGGIGKTQIAIEYAYRYREEYQIVLWAQAESIEGLNASYSQFATQLNLPEKGEQKQEIIIEAVKRWLQNQSKWLLILDNAEDLTQLQGFLPLVMGGHLLITTRASVTGQIARRVEVETFTEEQGALLLLRRSAMIAPDVQLSGGREQDQMLARAISRELGGLPLALDQAGAYLEQTGYSLSDYQQIYQQHREALLRERGKLVTDYPDTIATTWSLSFARVEQKSALAVEVLRLCAYLSADAIPLEVMTEGIEPMAENLFVLGQAIKVLREYSLVSHDTANRTLSIHRLVQVVIRDVLSTEEQMIWMQRAVRRVEANFLNDPENVAQWNIYEQWLPHALTCVDWIKQGQMTLSEAARLLNATGDYLCVRSRYPEAEPLLMCALSIRQQLFGDMHPDTAQSLYNLAVFYRYRGKLKEAEPLAMRALSICEQLFGDMHPDTAQSLHNLALLSRDLGKYAEAEPLFARTLSIREQLFGDMHLHTVESLDDLALLSRYRGKLKEAELLSTRALSISEQLFRKANPSTGASLHNLANLYIAASLHNLANLYRDQGKYAEAEPLLTRALSIHEQLLGDMHHSTATSLNHLATLYRDLGKYTEAESLYKRALSIREQLFGDMHLHTVESLNGLALLSRYQGKLKEAELLSTRALSIREQMLGPLHPTVAQSLNNLANFYRDQGRYTEAEPLFTRALSIREQMLGPLHPNIAQILNNLANFIETREGTLKRSHYSHVHFRSVSRCWDHCTPIQPKASTTWRIFIETRGSIRKRSRCSRVRFRSVSRCWDHCITRAGGRYYGLRMLCNVYDFVTSSVRLFPSIVAELKQKNAHCMLVFLSLFCSRWSYLVRQTM